VSITRDTLLLAASIILTLWAIVSSVRGVSAIVREAWRGDLRAGTMVRGVSAVLGLVIVLWGLVVTLGL
jgi:hypothetical protein